MRGRVNLLRRDGSPLPAEFTAMATLDADGRSSASNGSVRDMTETDRLERELRESENRYRDLASSSPDMVFATDPQGVYTFVSDAAASILGWDLGEAIGRSFTDYVPEDALPLAAASFAALIAAPDEVQHSRIPFRHADGREIPLEINVIGNLDGGKLVGIHGVARDVSDRERLERELQDSEARLRQIVQTTPDVIWRSDADGHFTFVADRVVELFGWTADELVGQHFSFVIARRVDARGDRQLGAARPRAGRHPARQLPAPPAGRNDLPRRGHGDRPDRGWPVHRRAGHGPRHQRARAPRTGAAPPGR